MKLATPIEHIEGVLTDEMIATKEVPAPNVCAPVQFVTPAVTELHPVISVQVPAPPKLVHILNSTVTEPVRQELTTELIFLETLEYPMTG